MIKIKKDKIRKVRTHQEGKYEENMLPLFPSSLTWARKFHTQDEWKDLCLFLFQVFLAPKPPWLKHTCGFTYLFIFSPIMNTNLSLNALIFGQDVLFRLWYWMYIYTCSQPFMVFLLKRLFLVVYFGLLVCVLVSIVQCLGILFSVCSVLVFLFSASPVSVLCFAVNSDLRRIQRPLLLNQKIEQQWKSLSDRFQRPPLLN